MRYIEVFALFLLTSCYLPRQTAAQVVITLEDCGVAYIDPQDASGSTVPGQDTLLYTSYFATTGLARNFYVDINAFGGQQVDRARVDAILPDGSLVPMGSLAFGSCFDCVEGFALVHNDSLLVEGVTDQEVMNLWIESLYQPPYALPGNLQTLSGAGRISGRLPFCAVGWQVEFVVFSNPANTSTEFSTYIFCPEVTAGCEVQKDIQLDCPNDSLYLTALIPPGCFSETATVSWTTPAGILFPATEVVLPLTGNLGPYVLEIADEFCVFRDTILVENPPFAEAGPDVERCTGEAVALAGAGGTGHFWTLPGGDVANDSLLVIAELQAADSGIYVLHAFNEDGCEDTDSLRLTVHIPPTPQIEVSEACLGDTLRLNVLNDTAFAQLSWLDPAGAPASPVIPGFREDDAGTYQLVATDPFGCSASEVFAVNAYPLPEVEWTVVRSCDSTRAYIAPDNYQYLWETGDQGSTFATANGGTYQLTVTDDNGCSTVEQIDIPAPDGPEVELQVEHPLCPGDPGRIEVIPVIDDQPLIYSIDGGASYGLRPVFERLSPGIYPVAVQDGLGCVRELEVEILQPDTMGVALGVDRLEVRPGTPVSLTATTIGNIAVFQWLPREIDSGGPVTDFVANNNMDIRIIVEDERGCRASTGFPLTIVLGDIYVPNAFSPNGDGFNDHFTFFSDNGSGEIIEHLQVFDRWGSLLFETTEAGLNEEAAGWDGSLGGRPLTSGVYTYHGIVRFGDGTRKRFKGSVTLLR